MRYFLPSSFMKELRMFPPKIQAKFWKQLNLLLKNLRHPSLATKKYGGVTDLWQARLDYHFRFYFRIVEDIYIIVSIEKHRD